MTLAYLVFGFLLGLALASFGNIMTFTLGMILFFALGRQFFIASLKVPDSLSDFLVKNQMINMLSTRAFSLILAAAGITFVIVSAGVFGATLGMGGQLLAFAVMHYVGIVTSPKVDTD